MSGFPDRGANEVMEMAIYVKLNKKMAELINAKEGDLVKFSLIDEITKYDKRKRKGRPIKTLNLKRYENNPASEIYRDHLKINESGALKFYSGKEISRYDRKVNSGKLKRIGVEDYEPEIENHDYIDQ